MTTIVFVHGNSSDGESFFTLFDNFTDAGHICLRFDLPGHGQSQRLKAYSVNSLSQSLVQFINDRKLIDYVLVGHSLGGHIVLQSLPQLSPTGVLVFGTPPLSKPMPSEAFQNRQEMGAYMQETVDDEMLDRMAQMTFSNPSDRAGFKRKFRQTDSSVRPAILRSLTLGDYIDEINCLETTTCPVLLANCLEDQIVNQAYIARLSSQIENRYVTVEQWPTDHTPHVTSPHFFIDKVIEFCSFIYNPTSLPAQTTQEYSRD